MSCSTRDCAHDAMLESHLCLNCFQKKWGPSPASQIPLPVCLTNIVLEFIELAPSEYAGNLEMFYLKLDQISINNRWLTAVFAISQSTDLQRDMNVFPFIADRYCGSSSLWDLLISHFPNPYERILLHYSPQIGKLFAKYHKMELTHVIVKHIMTQPQNVSPKNECEKILSISDYSTDYTLQVFETIVACHAHRALQCIIDIGYFESRQNIIFVLEKLRHGRKTIGFFIKSFGT